MFDASWVVNPRDIDSSSNFRYLNGLGRDIGAHSNVPHGEGLREDGSDWSNGVTPTNNPGVRFNGLDLFRGPTLFRATRSLTGQSNRFFLADIKPTKCAGRRTVTFCETLRYASTVKRMITSGWTFRTISYGFVNFSTGSQA